MISTDCIVAPATPYGLGSIAIVRISGAEAFRIAKRITKKKKRFALRHATRATLYTGENNAYDDVLVIFFKAPASYTGEDVVEISCHGNPIIVQTTVKECVRHGARLAEPGEFTRRAFINGKLDLLQVEAVGALIYAQSEKCAYLNQRTLTGVLSQKLKEIKDQIIQTLAYVEFELDISDKDIAFGIVEQLKINTDLALKELRALSASYQEGRLINNGAKVVITGKPNVGKSTLLNALAEEDRAIVSATPGTTRDTVEARLIYDGISVHLTDTAGVRNKSNNPIEQEGIKRARKKVAAADLVLRVFTPNVNLPQNSESNGTNEIKLMNKMDTVSDQVPVPKDILPISAKSGQGLHRLKREIKKRLGVADIASHNLFITTQRQFNIVRTGVAALTSARETLENAYPALELVAIDLREGLNTIDEMLGKTTANDILNNIFSTFCVGK